MRRLAIARLWHEGNSFSPVATTAADVRRREWRAGDPAIDFYRGTATELGAAVDLLGRRPDWRATFLRCAAAPPAGSLEAGLFEAIRDEILEGLAGGVWDAVYLSLHGALLAEGVASPDHALIDAVRRAIGEAVPLAVSFDLHANVDPAIEPLVDVVVGYKTHPHVDMDAAGAKALGLVMRAAEGAIRPVVAVAKAGCVLPSFNMRTAAGPMAEIVGLARAVEQREGLLDVTAFGGFAYGDVAYGGGSATAVADGDRGLARARANQVAAAMTARREEFRVTLPTPEDGIARALADGVGPIAVLDPADNPLSGGIGDTPALFRALLAAPPPDAVFAFFHDPGVVARAHQAGVGAALEGALGGRLTADFGPPVPVTATVARLTDGRFVNRGPMEAGLAVDLGRTCVLDVGGVRVIVGEACVAANDPAYFALHGVDLATTRLLCVKAKNHFRAAFAPLCRAIVDVDAPGPACLDLGQLPFRHALGLAAR